MNEAPRPKRKWLPIVAGVLLLVCVLGVAAVIAGAVWVRQHLQITPIGEAGAMQTFDEVTARFPGAPLLEFRDGEPRVTSDRGTSAGGTGALTTLHILAFDAGEGQLARFEVPFWFLRLKSGPIAFSTYATGVDADGIDLRVEDIERHGPGIVIDLARPGEGRVLVWAE
jgi:hypothetical protein